MPDRCRIPSYGGRLVEGWANGLGTKDLCGALRDNPLSEDTLKGYAARMYRDFGFENRPKPEVKKFMTTPKGRAVGMCIVAGLLQSKDIKPPTHPFMFTMNPGPDCVIQYYDTFDHKGARHVWPKYPVIDIHVPNGPPMNSYRIELNPGERTYMTAILLGMSSTQIDERKIDTPTLDQMRYACTRTGFKGIVQLSAYCAVNNLITVPEEVLRPAPEYVPPAQYDRPVMLELPPAFTLED